MLFDNPPELHDRTPALAKTSPPGRGRGKLRSRVILLLLPLLCASASVRADEPVPIPDGVFFYSPAATVFGPEAVWTNPSALGGFKANSLLLMADYADDAIAESWGAVLNRKSLGLAYRTIETGGDDLNEYLIAGGLPLGNQFSIGGSYRFFTSGPSPYGDRHFWNLALSSKGNSPFSFAAVWSNLNKSGLGDDDTEIIQRYSLGYRPSGSDRFTFSIDAFSTSSEDTDSWRFVYHAEVIPTPGLFVDGFIDSEKNFQVGVRANLLKYLVGAQSHFNSDADHRFTHVYAGVTDARQPSLIKEKTRRLSMTIDGHPAENPVQPVFGTGPIPFGEMVLDIYRAAEDPTIDEMILNLDFLSVSLAQAQELRHAMAAFRGRNKRIICHLTGPNNSGYFVASAADSILIPPVSQLNLVGLRMELTYFAGTMEKLGIEADIVRFGDYKAAPEAFTRTAPSEESRVMSNYLLDDLFEQFVTGIADGRNLSIDSVRTLIDHGPHTSLQALESGLVDGLSYRDRLAENAFLRPMPEISYRKYRADTLLNDGWPRLPEIAVVFADGEITGRQDPDPFTGGDDAVTPPLMSRAFRRVLSNSKVRGVVLRVNSPGGWALAGDDILHDALRTTERLPMTVSMGTVAASGGYYISMASPYLFVEPATITGSIGIYGGKAVLEELYDKIDLNVALYTRGRHAGMMTTTRPFTDDERAKYSEQLEAFYLHFVDLVAENRDLTADSIDALARGKVWTGRSALDIGLADELGGLKQAIDYTAEQAGLDNYRVVRYPQRRRLFRLPDFSPFGIVGRWLGLGGDGGEALEKTIQHTVEPLADAHILARLPYNLVIE